MKHLLHKNGSGLWFILAPNTQTRTLAITCHLKVNSTLVPKQKHHTTFLIKYCETRSQFTECIPSSECIPFAEVVNIAAHLPE